MHARRWWGLVLCLFVAFAGAGEAPGERIPVSELRHTAWLSDKTGPGESQAMAQTPDGWLWVGGWRGLFRFDGDEFERVTLQGRDPTQPDAVWSLFAESSGELWIGYSNGGASRLSDGTFHHYGRAEGIMSGGVLQFARDAQGTLWAACVTALLRFDGERWHKMGPESGFTDLLAESLHLDQRGTFWIAGDERLFYVARGNPRIQASEIRVKDSAGFLQSADGRSWYHDAAGAYLLPEQAANAPRHSHATSSKSRLALFDREGDLWVSQMGQVRRYRVPAGSSRVLFDDASYSDRFTANDLTGTPHPILEDQEGNIWVATGGGLDRFRRTNVHKLLFDGEVQSGQGFAAGERGTMWVGLTFSGLESAPTHGLWKYDGRLTRVAPGVITDVTAIERDTEDAIWIGSPQGIWRIENGGRVHKLPALPAEAADRPIRALTVDLAGDPWVSVFRSILYKFHDGKWQPYGNVTGLPTERPRAQARDAQGRLWFAYLDRQLAVVQEDRVRIYGPSDGLQLGMLNVIHPGRYTVVAGQRHVALLIDEHLHKLIAVDDPGALEGVTGIVETRDGDLWLNGFRGAVRIAGADLDEAVRDLTYTVPLDVFDIEDGYPGMAQQALPLRTLVQGSDGVLWFAGTVGSGRLDPKRLRRNKIPPPLHIRSVLADGKSYVPAGTAQLPKATHNLQINYTATSLTRPERVRFRYRLDGYDETWIDAGSRREAFYTNLPPGQYRFQVIAANESGVWNETGTSVGISIPPTFTQTNMFVALCVIAGALVLWAAYSLRIRQVTARERSRLEERLTERERIARELHDTLLQGVYGLILRLQSTLSRADVPGEAREAINAELDRADALLIDGRDRVKNLRSATTAPTGLMQALLDAATQMSSDRTAQLRVIESGTARELHPIVREEAARIATEAMLNAVRHAAAKTIEVEISYERRQLRINVRDDGRGMEEAVVRAGRDEHFGILGMHERARRIRSRVDVWSRPGAGTEVSLTVPARMAYVRRLWTRSRFTFPFRL